MMIAIALAVSFALTAPDEIDTLVDTEMNRQKIPGLAVAIIKDGRVDVAKGYGLSNVELGTKVTRETIFQSGSVGKQMTAFTVMTLVDQGKIKLDESITTYLPKAPASWKPITVRHVLTHTAGIRTWEPGKDIDFRKDYTEDELLTIAAGMKLDFAAGQKWAYSNTGYAVLGILISKVTGRFYGDYVREKVFVPMGMKTARMINEADIIPHRAAGYQFRGKTLINQEWVSPTLNSTADGSYYLSLDDFIAWDTGLTAGKLIKAESYQQMWTDAKTANGKATGYGFGWLVETTNGHRRQHHAGEWQGFTSYIDRYPDRKLTVLLLCNSASAGLFTPGSRVDRLARSIAVAADPALGKKPLTDNLKSGKNSE